MGTVLRNTTRLSYTAIPETRQWPCPLTSPAYHPLVHALETVYPLIGIPLFIMLLPQNL